MWSAEVDDVLSGGREEASAPESEKKRQRLEVEDEEEGDDSGSSYPIPYSRT
jgi:hypothetical protein